MPKLKKIPYELKNPSPPYSKKRQIKAKYSTKIETIKDWVIWMLQWSYIGTVVIKGSGELEGKAVLATKINEHYCCNYDHIIPMEVLDELIADETLLPRQNTYLAGIRTKEITEYVINEE